MQTAIFEQKLKREGLRRLNVSGVLRIIGVSRSGYNSFKEREFNMSAKLSYKEELKNLVLNIHLWSKQIYGAPKITRELKKQGIRIAEKTVGNYMREMGLKAHYIKPYIKTTIDPDFDNRLKKATALAISFFLRFTKPRPPPTVQGDILNQYPDRENRPRGCYYPPIAA